MEAIAQQNRPSRAGWALLVLVLFVAALLRFWQLGDAPAGLYRDEAYNGLDALALLAGDLPPDGPFYYPANNGREPLYISLTAAAVALLGRTALAVRLAAAVAGTLTTVTTFLMAEAWFGRRVGLLAALLWAITIWPVHLSRIGLRPVLLPLVLSLAAWLATMAYRRSEGGRAARWLWLLAGAAYGLSFYTYLAARVSPILVLAVLLILWRSGRGQRLWPGLAYAGLGALIVLAPLLLLFWRQPALILGRSGQVSVLNQAVNQGDLVGTLWRNGWRALGMFFVRGDTILRHNPAGRPVFDPLMAGPFLAGIGWCWQRRRQAAAAALLLWLPVMLIPTVLAEDTPHFLRAAGLLPGLVVLPALGLSFLGSWSKLPGVLRPWLVVGLLLGSLVLGVRDYFYGYASRPQTGYWFDAAARDLAENINSSEESVPGSPGGHVYVDRRFWDGWPTIRFLVDPARPVTLYDTESGPLAPLVAPAMIFVWPYERPEATVAAIGPGSMVAARLGSLVQGDLEAEAYPLYVQYEVAQPPALQVLARFGEDIRLAQAVARVAQDEIAPGRLTADLYWLTDEKPEQTLASFVHVVGADGAVWQSDHLPGEGYLAAPWWHPGLVILDRHEVELPRGADSGANSLEYQILVGLYDVDTGERLPVMDGEGRLIGDAWPGLRPTE